MNYDTGMQAQKQMAYGASPAVPPYSLSAGMEGNLSRMIELSHTLEQLCDRLHGAVPTPVGDMGQAGSVNSLAVITRQTTEQIERCFAAMQRIGGAL